MPLFFKLLQASNSPTSSSPDLYALPSLKELLPCKEGGIGAIPTPATLCL